MRRVIVAGGGTALGLALARAALARGDEEMARVIRDAWQAGAHFDSWTEEFHGEAWKTALAAAVAIPIGALDSWVGAVGTLVTPASAAIAAMGALILHIYMGVFVIRGSWEAITRGTVSRRWAEAHHGLWFRQLRAAGSRSQE